MKKQIPEFKEKLRLLNLLLVNEVNERMDIAYIHHGKSADLVSVKIKLQRIQLGSLDAKTTIPEVLAEINSIFDNTRLINRAIYPKEVNDSGLIAAFKHRVTKIETAHKLKITYGQFEHTKLNLPVVTALALYNILIRTVKCLALAKYKNVALDIEVKRGVLFFSANGSNKFGKPLDRQKLISTLELIEAGIIWQNVDVLESTNWQNCFCYSFSLNESTL